MTSKTLKFGTDRVMGDSALRGILGAAAVFVIGLLIALAYELFSGSLSTIKATGFSFLTGANWDPYHEIYGALPFIYGTLLTSLIALVIGLPISLGVAIFLTERLKSRKSLGHIICTLVELLAAVPSVIFGLWGLFFLKPFMVTYIETPLHVNLGFIPLFAGTPFGLDFLTAGVILAIMIIPTVSAITRDVLNAVPNSQREAMYSLGATNWEMLQKAVLPYARSGIFGATILGLGRAVGETMAVTMVVGNATNITANLFSPGYTLASLIANQFFESANTAPFIEIGLILFFLALVINIFARLMLWRLTRGVRYRV